MESLKIFFKLEELGSDFKTEMIGGATTFMTMSYIIFVQPAVLAKAGMDSGSVMVATCISSALATLIMGLWANYPIAQAPAMGHNFYFVFAVCLGMGIPWQIALGANFISGMIFTLMSLYRIRELIIDAIPESIKMAIAGGIGLLIGFVGLQWAGLVVGDPGSLVKLGPFSDKAVLLSCFGLMLTSILISLRVRGSILWGMLVTATLGIIIGVIKFQGVISSPPSILPTFFKLNILDALQLGFITIITVFLFLDVFDSVGTLIGVSEQAGFLKDGKLPRANRALLSDAVGTVVGTLLGTSTVSSYIESAAGVQEGARTGLANMICAGLFLVSLFFYPLVKMVGTPYTGIEGVSLYPVVAPALIIIGYFMIRVSTKIPWQEPTEAIPAYLTLVSMPLTFSIADGLAIGFISYTLIKLCTGKYKEVSWLVYILAILFALRYALI